jgi:hypothetical protein
MQDEPIRMRARSTPPERIRRRARLPMPRWRRCRKPSKRRQLDNSLLSQVPLAAEIVLV